MKNINRDYLVKVDVKTAEITPAPKDMVFFTTDVLTSNIFFQLEGLDNSNSALQENANDYSLTLRVVKPNNEPKTIKAERLDQETNFYVADLGVSFVDIPGFYECELFIDTNINGRAERSTTDPFEYEVKKSIFYNLDDIIDSTYISIEDIATIDYVNKVTVGDVSLDGYATEEQLNAKANKEHTHDDYVTQTQLNDALKEVDALNINLEDFVVSNSISIKRKEHSTVGQYSTAEGYDTTASGVGSHAEGGNTKASNYCSHAEGTGTTASGDSSHAEGFNTTASGPYSHVEGYNTTARGRYQHVQGKYNAEDTSNMYANIVGNGTASNARSNAHTLDWDGNAWFAGDVKVGAGNKVLATKDYVDNAVGNVSYDDTELRGLIANKANSNHTHDEYLTKVPDEYITQTELDEALGDIGTGGGNVDTDNLVVTNSISMGRYPGWATGRYSTATGEGVIASNYASHAEGCSYTYYRAGQEWITQPTRATGYASHAEGGGTQATGGYSHAEGIIAQATGIASHAEGEGTYASYDHQHVQGRYNINGNYAHIVGNGRLYDDDSRVESSNAHTLDWSGNAVYAGTVTATSHPTTSDRTLKENIKYISNASTINDESITLAECYDFIKDDLAIATYNYIADEDDRQKIGFIAQDLLYNEDQTDNKVGQLIIDNFQGTDMGKGENKLTYDSNNLFGVMLAAMQVMANKIEYLEQKLENIEGDK